MSNIANTTETAEVTEAARKRRTQVSCVLSDEQIAALEDYRWTNRIGRRSDVVKLAIEQLIKNQ